MAVKDSPQDESEQSTDERFKKILDLLHSQNAKVNLFEKFNVDKLFETFVLSVDPKFQGLGIAKQLLVNAEQVAREQGFKVKKLFI